MMLIACYCCVSASPFDVGAVISHIINGMERPIMFASRALTPAEKNYSQIDREALAIISALDKFLMFIYGRKVKLITDNRPLCRIFHHRAKLPPMTASGLLRYEAHLSTFDYEVQHRPSKDHANADFLSRFPVSTASCQGAQPMLDFEVSRCQEETLHQIA